MSDHPVPADPPSPLTAEDILADVLNRASFGKFTTDDMQRIAKKQARALSALDAARAPDAGLRAALEDAFSDIVESNLHGLVPAASRMRLTRLLTAAALAAPAPAGLDEIERLIAALRPRPNLQGSPVNAYCQARDDALLIVRAATRPAEDAGHE